ncbi:alpha-L-arabinofuranosidase C-terminal domain-containing protein [Sunxiuqinia sp. A32]|uniref:alpha-L-arabinofuranosidase C-terminal domain-containing protein n=1 Tax=Sunxiuqinia sp. A32 TaxID=3461496 RepID=UPI00404637D4
MKKIVLIFGLISILFSASVNAQKKIEVLVGQANIAIQPTMWGVFFEDINFAADGGLYAELVINRSFKFPNPLEGWKVPFRDSVFVINEKIEGQNHRYIQLQPLSSGQTNFIQNVGFRGMGIQKGEEYRLKLRSKFVENNDLSLNIDLLDMDGESIGHSIIKTLNNNWEMNELILKATKTCEKANLKISMIGDGIVDIDYVSLFPVHTFKNRENGMRADLAQMLADLQPGFVRFPGGCIVEGHHLDLRYQWKKTVGDIDDRELIINRWNTEFMHRHTPDYYQSFGLGFYEYFVLAEDLNAEPLPILNCGMACQYNTGELVPLDEMDPYIQDAIDLIEFANAPVDNKWGKLRAEMGHPEPFNLKYLGIGNEQWGIQYLERYQLIAEKVHAKYPDVKLVSGSGPSSDGDRFEYLWKELKGKQADLVDEHYYRDPEWFFNGATRYDSYDRDGLKVFAGEFASHTRVNDEYPSSNNNWLSALSEAAFMTGLERNADVVYMASYAPLLAHKDAWQWRPDLIWFDNLNAVATPNYYVQKMYSTHRGTHMVPVLSEKEILAGDNGLYSSASIDKNSGHIYLKLVNSKPEAEQVTIQFKGRKIASDQVKVTELYSDQLMKYNTLEKEDVIVPVEKSMSLTKDKLTLELKPQSFILVDVSCK